MSRARIEQRLTQVEENIARETRNIARHRELLSELEGDGVDTMALRRLLDTVEETRRLHMAERERLERELQSAWTPRGGKSEPAVVPPK
jgi:hypothetical protein